MVVVVVQVGATQKCGCSFLVPGPMESLVRGFVWGIVCVSVFVLFEVVMGRVSVCVFVASLLSGRGQLRSG